MINWNWDNPEFLGQEIDLARGTSPKSRGHATVKEGAWFSEGPLRRLLRNASILASGRFLSGLFNFTAMTLIVQSVGLETFGALVLVHSIMSMISDVVKFHSWQAVLRYGTPALEKNRILDFRRLIKLTVLLDLGSGMFGVIVAVIAVPQLASSFGWSNDLVPIIQVYAFSILFMVTATPTGLLRLFDRFDLLSVSNAIASFVRVLAGLWVVAFGGDLEILLLFWFISTIVGGLWLMGHAYRSMSATGTLTGPPLGYRELATGHEGIVSFLFTIQVNSTLAVVSRRLPPVYVGYLLSPAATGLYEIARQVTTLLSAIGKGMRPAIYPELARLEALNDLAGFRQLLRRTMVLMAGVGVVVVVPFVLFGRAALSFIFGAEVAPAFPLAVVLAVNAAIGLISFPLAPALISIGHPGAVLKVRVASITVFLLGMLILVPKIGLIGSGVAALPSVLVSITGHSIALSRWFKRRSSEVEAPPEGP
jgi:O-antigen/teichoic acid export membrane protein